MKALWQLANWHNQLLVILLTVLNYFPAEKVVLCTLLNSACRLKVKQFFFNCLACK